MLCSKCSATIKPIVVNDIDGNLADYHEDFAKFCWRYWDLNGREDPWYGGGEFEDYLGVDKAMYREAKLAYRQGGGKRMMPLIKDSLLPLDAARNEGAEIWLATTRPWMRHDSTDPDTRFWLARNGIYFDHLLYDEAKYSRLWDLVDSNRVVMIIEDLGEMYDRAETLFPGKAVQISRTHNLEDRRPGRMGSATAAEEVKIRVRRWYKEHNGTESR